VPMSRFEQVYSLQPLNYDVAFVVDVVLGSRRHRSRSHIYIEYKEDSFIV